MGGSANFRTGIGLRIGRRYVRHSEQRWKQSAFANYEHGLREYLNVCLEGDHHAECGPLVREGVRWEFDSR